MLPVAVFALLALIWGFSWVAIRLSLEGLPTFQGAALRFLIASLLLALFARLRGVPLRLPPGSRAVVLQTAVLIYLVDYGLIYWAQGSLSAGVTAVLFATFPLFTALLRPWFVGARLSPLIYLGLAVAFGGVAMISLDEWSLLDGGPRVALALAAVLVAALAAAFGTLLVEGRLTRVPAVTLSAWQMLFGALGLGVVGWMAGERSDFLWTSRALAGFLYLTVMASAVAFSLYYWLLRRTSSVTVSSMVYLTPFVALAGDRLVFDRPLTWEALAGTGLVLTGVSFAEMARRRGGVSRPTTDDE